MATTTPTISTPLPVLREDNPFYNGVVFVFPDGSLSLDRTPVQYSPSVNDRYYTVSENESITDISFAAYGDSKYWWVLADVNNIFTPWCISAGTTLVVPDLDEVQVNSL